jgi:hypothetical protein
MPVLRSSFPAAMAHTEAQEGFFSPTRIFHLVFLTCATMLTLILGMLTLMWISQSDGPVSVP